MKKSILVEGILLNGDRYGTHKQSHIKSNRDFRVYQNMGPDKNKFLQWDSSRNPNRIHLIKKHKLEKNELYPKNRPRFRVVDTNQGAISHKVDKKLNTRQNRIGN